MSLLRCDNQQFPIKLVITLFLGKRKIQISELVFWKEDSILDLTTKVHLICTKLK